MLQLTQPQQQQALKLVSALVRIFSNPKQFHIFNTKDMKQDGSSNTSSINK